MFNYIKFFEDYNIEYWTEGENVPTGGVNTRCYSCSDKSNHLVWNGYSTFCWKCHKHSLYKSIKDMLQIEGKEVYKILNEYQTSDVSTPNLNHEPKKYNNKSIDVPGMKLLKPHYNYLEGRGFDAKYIENKYDLRATLSEGEGYAYRIIIPIYYQNRIVSYLGRDFTNRQKLRYMTCKPEKEIIPHKNILYNLDNCNYRTAIVVEGTMDAMKLGDNCCATFGTAFKKEQLLLLREKFDKIFTMFDGDDEAQKHASILANKFNLLGGKTENIRLESGDPGEMSLEEVKELKRDLNL